MLCEPRPTDRPPMEQGEDDVDAGSPKTPTSPKTPSSAGSSGSDRETTTTVLKRGMRKVDLDLLLHPTLAVNVI